MKGLDWIKQAACADYPPECWELPGHGDNHTVREALNAIAVAICNACPVRGACLADTSPQTNGVIRAGVAFSGKAVACVECGDRFAVPRRGRNKWCNACIDRAAAAECVA